MTKPIKLIYWRDVPNLGDILSPYIVKALSKRETGGGDGSITSKNYGGL